MKRWLVLMLVPLFATGARAAPINLFENFDNLASSGWIAINVSLPVGTTSWFQGNPAIFPAFAGAPNSYAAANFLSTDPAGGTISTWLLSPEIEFAGQQILSFYTRTEPGFGALFGDGLRVLRSASGASTVLANFSPILAINAANVGGAYPEDWTRFSAILAGGGTGRLAFQYTVGPSALANYIGLDSVSVAVPEPYMLALVGIGLALAGIVKRRN